MTLALLPRDWLRALGLSLSDTAVWTMRGVVFVAGLALVGSQAWKYRKRTRARILALEDEVSRLKAPTKPNATSPIAPAELPEIQQRILVVLAGVDCLIDDELFKCVAVSTPTFDYHIEQLCRADLIFTDPTYDNHSHWQLTQKGLAYVVEHQLVK